MFTLLMVFVLVGAVLTVGILLGAAVALGARRQEQEPIQQSAAVAELPDRRPMCMTETESAPEQTRRAA